ncbi:MAG: biotin--[acetyl-CoA-carboxylase] ligase, partial [Acidimicrobiales bacterium]
VRWVGETGSTNRDLLDLAADGAPEGVVLVADHQTAGRGRLDRSWVAPADSSLLLSVLFRPTSETPPVGPVEAHLLTTAVGVSAVEACGIVAGVSPRLKWPNDLVVTGADGSVRKLSGILAESTVTDGELDAVVVGLGLNVNWPAPDSGELPPDLSETATALNHLAGHLVDREEVLVALLQRLDHWHRQPASDLMSRARSLSATIGSRVRVDLGDEQIVGRAVEITDRGGLLVELDGDSDGGQRREVIVGDVVHLRPAD